MKDELQQHKTSNTVKWILTLIAFVLVGVLLISMPHYTVLNGRRNAATLIIERIPVPR